MVDAFNEPEDYDVIEYDDRGGFQSGGKQEQFNHQLLVQEQYRRTQMSLSVEMRESYTIEKRDKIGNISYEKIPDSRKACIECVKTLYNTMIADIKGTEFKNKISELFNKEKDLSVNYANQQKTFIISLSKLSQKQIMQYNHITKPDVFIENWGFYNRYLNELVDIYREIFMQLELALEELKYYRREKKVVH